MGTGMLSELIGNQAVKSRIAASLSAGRLPHALLIEGPRGSGRRTLAWAIARALVCDSGNACGQCRNCRQAAGHTHPDILTYQPETSVFTVDLVRKINADAMIKPNQAACKVMILQDCERMNAQAQNAFLKTLEEPPGRVHFILLTQNSKLLLDTIRSRCAIFLLAAPGFDEALQYVCSRGYEKTAAEAALRQSECNIGSALAVLDGAEDPLALDIGQLLHAAAADQTMEVIKQLAALEKDKNKTALLLERLEQYTAQAIRRQAATGGTACGYSLAGLLQLQQDVAETAAALQQNGSRPLLLTLLCEKMIRAARK